MDEYKRIHRKYKKNIIPIKIICFSFCLIILVQDICMTFKLYNSNPFTVITKLKEVTYIETPTLSICISHQMNIEKFKRNHAELYEEIIKYYENDYLKFRDIVFSNLTVGQHFELSIGLHEIGTCLVLLKNRTYISCGQLRGISSSLTPFRLCFSLFERNRLNQSDFVYEKKVLKNKPWIKLKFDKSKMRRHWIDIVLNWLPRARLCYHGFAGFRSLSTNYYRLVKIAIELETIKKLKEPFLNDCEDYNPLLDFQGCYSRESCIELCYANESLNKYQVWPKNLQIFGGLVDLNKIHFSSDQTGISSIREACGKLYPKSDCLTYKYNVRIIDEKMVSQNDNSTDFEIHIYSYFETQKSIIYEPTFDSSQLYHSLSQSIASFLGFCVFDVYKILIFLYKLIR